MTRRELLKKVAIISLLVGCGETNEKNIAPEPSPPPDIMLQGNDQELANAAAGQFDALWDLANNPGQILRVGAENEVLQLSMVNGGYRHLRIKKESDQEEVRLLWGSKRLLPSVKIADNEGNTLLNEDGSEMEFGLSDFLTGNQAPAALPSREELVKLGIAVVAVALAVWIGASIAKLVIATVAFLAFNAMVLGILVVGVAALTPILEAIFKKTDWDLEGVKNFLSKGAKDTSGIIQEIFQLAFV